MHVFSKAKNWAARQRRFIPEWLWRPARSVWFLLVAVFWRRRQVEHSYVGNRLKVWITDPVSEEWYDGDWHEPREIALLKASARRRGRGGLKPGATVFNLGAHQAVVALVLGKEASPGGRVVALEAAARNAALGGQNVAANQMERVVTVLHAAAGPADGQISFDSGFNGQVATGRRITSASVPMRSVDSLAAEYGAPDVVFLDVEGFEGKVLEGARATLAANRTDWFIEIHAEEDLARFNAAPASVLAAFPAAAFDCHAMEDPAVTPSARFRPLSECADVSGSGKRFYFLATWK